MYPEFDRSSLHIIKLYDNSFQENCYNVSVNATFRYVENEWF